MKRKILTLILVLATFFGVVAVSNLNTETEALKASETLYFTPNGNWKSETGGWYAAVFASSGWSNSKWVKLNKVEGATDLYSCIVPSDFTISIIQFQRMKAGTSTFDWGNKWDSATTNIQSNANYYVMTEGTWNGNNTGTWTVYKTPAEQAEENASALNTLKEKYYNSGNYTKDTNIFLTEDAINRLTQNNGFHQTSELKRTTYYTADALWMSKTTSTGATQYSYYGTAADGNLTSATVANPKEEPSNPKIAATKTHENWHNTAEDGMEGFYITLKDIVATKEQMWVKTGDVYESTDAEVIAWFKAFCAPCYLGFTEGTENFIDLVKVSIEEHKNSLVLKLYASGTNDGLILNSDGKSTTDEVFAKAVVYTVERMKKFTITSSISLNSSEIMYAYAWGSNLESDGWYKCTVNGKTCEFTAPFDIDNADLVRYLANTAEANTKTFDKTYVSARSNSVLEKGSITWTTISNRWTLVGKINGVGCWENDLPMVNDGGSEWTITIKLSKNDEIKVRKNKGWDESYGTNAYDNYVISSAGTYKITYEEGKTSITVTKIA